MAARHKCRHDEQKELNQAYMQAPERSTGGAGTSPAHFFLECFAGASTHPSCSPIFFLLIAIEQSNIIVESNTLGARQFTTPLVATGCDAKFPRVSSPPFEKSLGEKSATFRRHLPFGTLEPTDVGVRTFFVSPRGIVTPLWPNDLRRVFAFWNGFLHFSLTAPIDPLFKQNQKTTSD
jgi:hypothetical protein